MKSRMRVSIRVILVICVILLAFGLYKGFSMLKQKEIESVEKAQKIEVLKDDIKFEEEKNEGLKKTKEDKDVTNEDYEAIARQEFGLIKKDEIVIKPR